VDGDRPPTRDCALNLVIDLSAPVPRPQPAGRPGRRADTAADPRIVDAQERAWKHRQDILERRRRILGEHHPDTLDSARGLARTLHVLGNHEQAEELEKWFARSG
jgi:hypothetical protein